ncbi:MAG: hypothetical protein ABEI06_06365 [Halobacteriaceae archaeon]
MSGAKQISKPTLWIDRYASVTGFEWLASQIFQPAKAMRYASYLFVVFIWTVITVGFSGILYFQTGILPLFQTPGLFVLLPGWLFVVYLAKAIQRRYYILIENLPSKDHVGPDKERRYESLLKQFGISQEYKEEPFREIVPRQIKVLLLIGGLGLYLLWFIVDPSPMQTFIDVYGRRLAQIYFYLVIPGIFYVFGVELISLYIGIHILLPLKVTMTERIDFSDPFLYGGLRPLGKLLRDSSVGFLALLSIYGIFVVVAVGSNPVDPFSQLILFGGITFGFIIFALPVYWIHKYMHHKKRAKIEEICEDIKDAGPEDDPNVFPETSPTAEEEFDKYSHDYIRLNRVENMKEFPVDFSLVLELLFVLLIPYLAHISSTFVFKRLFH